MNSRGFVVGLVAAGLGLFGIESFFSGPNSVVRHLGRGNLSTSLARLQKMDAPSPQLRTTACQALIESCAKGNCDREWWCLPDVVLALDCGRDNPSFASEYQRILQGMASRSEASEREKQRKEEEKRVLSRLDHWLSVPEVYLDDLLAACVALGTLPQWRKSWTADEVVELARDRAQRKLRGTGQPSQLCYLLQKHLDKFPTHHSPSLVLDWQKRLGCKPKQKTQ